MLACSDVSDVLSSSCMWAGLRRGRVSYTHTWKLCALRSVSQSSSGSRSDGNAAPRKLPSCHLLLAGQHSSAARRSVAAFLRVETAGGRVTPERVAGSPAMAAARAKATAVTAAATAAVVVVVPHRVGSRRRRVGIAGVGVSVLS